MRAGGRRDPASGLSRDTGGGKEKKRVKVLCERAHWSGGGSRRDCLDRGMGRRVAEPVDCKFKRR